MYLIMCMHIQVPRLWKVRLSWNARRKVGRDRNEDDCDSDRVEEG